MNNSGISTSAFANVVTPYSSGGRQAVGLEDAEAKQDALPPIEESAKTSTGSDDEDALKPQETLRSREENQLTERVEQQQQERQQEQQRQQISELAARDREVRAHEQAHAAVGGQYAGSPSYSFKRGPDGVNYAVGGEVPISLPSRGDNPQLTIAAAEQVRRAALAPADPSAQDRRIAAAAAGIAAQARADLAAQSLQEANEKDNTEEPDNEESVSAQADKQQTEKTAESNQEAKQQRLAEIRAAALKGSQLGEQLVALNNIENERNVGSVLDQLA